MKLSDNVQAHLINILQAVADAADGGDLARAELALLGDGDEDSLRGIEDIHKVYADAMECEEFQKFYEDQVNAMSLELYGV